LRGWKQIQRVEAQWLSKYFRLLRLGSSQPQPIQPLISASKTTPILALLLMPVEKFLGVTVLLLLIQIYIAILRMS
jgi:hypothetical protein